MNHARPARKTMTVTGGTFIGSPVGWNNKVSYNTITVGDVQTSASIADLKKAIASMRDDLVAAAKAVDAQAEVSYEIRKIEQELAGEQPRGAVVRSVWERVSEVLSPLAAASGIIAQITDLITKVFGGS